MEVKEVRTTPGFNLNMDIIHVLAPKSYESNDPINELLDAYRNILKVISSKGYKRVIMPSLGCGVHGYKHDTVAHSVMKLLEDYCTNNDTEIYFINKYPIYTDVYMKELIKIIKNK